MMYHVQYLTDSNGRQKAVQIPLKEWLVIKEKLEKAERKRKLLDDLKQAAKEVNAMQSGKLKEKTLREFLNEL
jgi:hypothetical protein